MDDQRIIDLYFARDQQAITASEEAYGAYCRTVSYNILRDENDAEECVNDTWLRSWEAIPPQRPKFLRAFFAKITRNLSLNRLEYHRAKKRGEGELPLLLSELSECVPDSTTMEQAMDEHLLIEALETFLRAQKPLVRHIFLRRYWFFCTVPAISRDLSVSESRVKATLFRTRKALKGYLEKEGFSL